MIITSTIWVKIVGGYHMEQATVTATYNPNNKYPVSISMIAQESWDTCQICKWNKVTDKTKARAVFNFVVFYLEQIEKEGGVVEMHEDADFDKIFCCPVTHAEDEWGSYGAERW